MKALRGWLLAWCCVAYPVAVSGDQVDDDLASLLATGPEGRGSVEALAASRRLRQQGTEILPRLLVAMDTPNVVAANWCRTVFDDIVLQEGAKANVAWPRDALLAYVQDGHHAGPPRRLALALITRFDPEFAVRWLPTQLDDGEFRGDAVTAVLALGDSAARARQNEAAREHFERAFLHARDSDQVLLAARKLRELGQNVDPIVHLGFVTRWFLCGPYEAPGTSGFDTPFPPEAVIDPRVPWPGKDATLPWKAHATTDALGQIDLIRAVAPTREAVAYACCELRSPRQQQVQLRCSADDNLTVWINGDLVLARRQWLNGTRLDRFRVPVMLRAGINRIVVKICQGPQHVDPAVPNNWTFQLRFCDATGAGVPWEQVRPTAEDLPRAEAAP